jgi:hypothetical protein
MPQNNVYVMWKQYLTYVSIVQAFAYTILIIFKFDEETYKIYLAILLIVELSYFWSIVIESFKAYEYEDYGVYNYETNWRKIMRKYWKSSGLKMQLLNLLPFGALGFIK